MNITFGGIFRPGLVGGTSDRAHATLTDFTMIFRYVKLAILSGQH